MDGVLLAHMRYGSLPVTRVRQEGGRADPARCVLVEDDQGAHPGMSAAEVLGRAGSAVELVSPERFFAPEMGG